MREDSTDIDCLWEAGWGTWQLEDWKRTVELWERVEAIAPQYATLQTHLPQARQKLLNAQRSWGSLSSGQRIVDGVILDSQDQPLGCAANNDVFCELRTAPYAHPEVITAEIEARIRGDAFVLPESGEACKSLEDYAHKMGIVGVREIARECEDWDARR